MKDYKNKVDIDTLKADLAQFNKESLLDAEYKCKYYDTYSNIEMNNFINKRLEFCSRACLKGKNPLKDKLSYEERDCYRICMRKIEEVDAVVNDFLISKFDLTNPSSSFINPLNTL